MVGAQHCVSTKEELRELFFKLTKKHPHSSLTGIQKSFERYLQSARISASSTRFMAYEPFPSEPDVLQILIQMGAKHIYVPVVRGHGLLARELKLNRFLPLHKIDVVIAPALFVQRNGYRLGRGGGFFDRLLRFYDHRRSVFLGYDWQVQKEIPLEEHDRRVSAIITETGFMRCYQLKPGLK